MAGRREMRVEMDRRGTSNIMVHLLPRSVQGPSDFTRALVTKWPVTQKRLVLERNGMKLGLGVFLKHTIYGKPLTVVFNAIWGSFGNKAKRIEICDPVTLMTYI